MTPARPLTPREVITAALAFCAGNFLWQALPGNDHNWMNAFERSWWVLIFAFYIAWRMKRAASSS